MKKTAGRWLCPVFVAAAIGGGGIQQIGAADWQKHVDRQNGFAVMYDSSLKQIAPNESATKLLLTSGEGQRCSVVVVPNPLATEENARRIVSAILNSQHLLEQEYRKIYKDVSLNKPRPIVASGKYDAAMITYAAKYEALGAELLITVIEVHLPIRQRTYKFGCSTAKELDDSFKSSAESFIRSFQLIPIGD